MGAATEEFGGREGVQAMGYNPWGWQRRNLVVEMGCKLWGAIHGGAATEPMAENQAVQAMGCNPWGERRRRNLVNIHGWKP